MNTTQLEIKEFNTLRHKVASHLERIEALAAAEAVTEEALRGLTLMKGDGKRAQAVLEAAASTRELPTVFVVELEGWIAKVDEMFSFVDEQ